MSSQFVASRAQKGVPIEIFSRNPLAVRPSGIRSLCREGSLFGVRFPRPGLQKTSSGRQGQVAVHYKYKFSTASHLNLTWPFLSSDGRTRRNVRQSRKWNICSKNGGFICGRKTQINAISNLEATGLGPRSNGPASQEFDTIILDVQGMKGASCVGAVRKLLGDDKRVVSVAVSLTTKTAAVHLRPSSTSGTGEVLKVGSELASRLTSSGFKSSPRPPAKTENSFRTKHKESVRKREELQKESSKQVAFALALGAFCFATHATHLLSAVGIQGFMGGAMSSLFKNPIYEACTAAAALVGPGRDLLVDGVKALWRRSPNVNSVVGVGSGAFCAMCAVSLIFPGLSWNTSCLDVPVMLLAFVLFGRAMDGQALAEASRGTHDLLTGLSSKSRLVMRETGTGEPTEYGTGLTERTVIGVYSEQLRPGDHVLVLPDEVIPVDGKVVEGSSVVDESLLLGIPLTVLKTTGNNVSAGTVNKKGPLTVEATATGAQSAVSSILNHVERKEDRSAVKGITDVFPGSSAFSVLTISAATFLFWYFIGAYLFPDVLFKEAVASGNAFLPSLRLAADVLVVGCFCTLGTAAPKAATSGRSKGPTIKRSFRTESREQSAGVVSSLSYKDDESFEEKLHVESSTQNPVEDEVAEAETDSVIEVKDKDGLTDADVRVDQPGTTLRDSVPFYGDSRSLIEGPDGVLKEDPALLYNDSVRQQPGLSGEDFFLGNDVSIASALSEPQLGAAGRNLVLDEVMPQDYGEAKEPGESGAYDFVGKKDYAGGDDSVGQRLGLSGEGILVGNDPAVAPVINFAEEQLGEAGKNLDLEDVMPKTFGEAEDSGGSGVRDVEDRGLQKHDSNDQNSDSNGESFTSEKADTGSVTLQLNAELLSDPESELAADDHAVEPQAVLLETEERSSAEKDSLLDTHDSPEAAVHFEAEKLPETYVEALETGGNSLNNNAEMDGPQGDNTRVEERGQSDESLIVGKDETGSLTMDEYREQELFVKTHVVDSQTEERSLQEKDSLPEMHDVATAAAQLEAEKLPPTYGENREYEGSSTFISEKDNRGPQEDDTGAEETHACDESFDSERTARSLTRELTPEILRCSEQDMVVENPTDAQVVGSETEECSVIEKNCMREATEAHDIVGAAVQFEAEESSGSKQDIMTEKDGGGLPVDESKSEEVFLSANGKEGLPIVETKHDEYKRNELDSVLEQDNKWSANVETECEDRVEAHDTAIATIQFDAEEHSTGKQEVMAKKDDGVTLGDETRNEERGIIEDISRQKETGRFPAVESSDDVREAYQLETVNSKLEDQSFRDQNVVLKADNAGYPSPEPKIEKLEPRMVALGMDVGRSAEVDSEGTENISSEQETESIGSEVEGHSGSEEIVEKEDDKSAVTGIEFGNRSREGSENKTYGNGEVSAKDGDVSGRLGPEGPETISTVDTVVAEKDEQGFQTSGPEIRDNVVGKVDATRGDCDEGVSFTVSEEVQQSQIGSEGRSHEGKVPGEGAESSTKFSSTSGEIMSVEENVFAEKDEEVLRSVGSEGEGCIANEELAANCDDASTVDIKLDFQRSEGAAEDRNCDEGERSDKEAREKTDATISKSGRKRLSKEDRDRSTKTKRKKRKDPTVPKRPSSAFMCFSQTVRKDLKKSRPELSFSDTGRVLGELWRSMSAEDKDPFVAMAEADKERFEREMHKLRGENEVKD